MSARFPPYCLKICKRAGWKKCGPSYGGVSQMHLPIDFSLYIEESGGGGRLFGYRENIIRNRKSMW